MNYEKSLYKKRGEELRIKDPRRVRKVWNGRRDPVTELGYFVAIHDWL